MLLIEKEIISYKIIDIMNLHNLSLDSSKQTIIDEILLSYSLDKNIKKEHLEYFKKDKAFNIYLLHIIQNKMKNIFSNSSCLQFKEILNIMNLLSYGRKYKLFTKYNNLSVNISKNILNDYELLLKNDFTKKDNSFEFSFIFYTTLLDSLIQVCIINSIDIRYKRNIYSIIELVQKSINSIKSSIKLSQIYLDILNKIYAKSLLYFSNTKHIDTDDYTIDILIYFFEQAFKKHVDAYSIIEHKKEEKNHYKIFLLTTTKLLLIMLKKLDTYNENYFYKLNIILKMYNKYFCKEEIIYKGNEDFRTCLLEKFVFIYDDKLEISINQLFNSILEKNKLIYNDIVIIHDFILFNNTLDKTDLIKALTSITNSKQEINDYYENYRLKTIDIILNKFIKLQLFDNIDKYITPATEYISKIKPSLHLIVSYAKIYLTISLHYSFQNKNNLTASKKYYFKSKKMYSFDFFKLEYSHITESILLNNAKKYLETNLKTNNTPTKDLLVFGNNLMQEFQENEKKSLNNEIYENILTIIHDILNKNNYSIQDAKNELILILSEKIFFCICECKIIKSLEIKNIIEEQVFNICVQEINTSYSIIYKYSNFYKDNFNKIYEEKQEFIKKISNTLFLLF